MNYVKPVAKATAKITTLGEWGSEEQALLRDVIRAPELPAAIFAVEWNVSELEDGAIRVEATGDLEFSDVISYASFALSDAFKPAQRENCVRLCEIMRKKKLLIHVELDEFTNPDDYWDDEEEERDYQNNSGYHFLLSSDGVHIVSRFVWCGTYDCLFYAKGCPCFSRSWLEWQYNQLTGQDMNELSDIKSFLIRKAIISFAVSLRSKLAPKPNEWWNKESGWDEWWKSEDDIPDANPLGMSRILNATQKEALLSLIQRELKRADTAENQKAFHVPTAFDNRFAGKTFLVEGKLNGYEPKEVERIITNFGGKVVKDMTNSVDYFIYGTGVGKPFKEALERGTTFVPPEYFEDMTR